MFTPNCCNAVVVKQWIKFYGVYYVLAAYAGMQISVEEQILNYKGH